MSEIKYIEWLVRYVFIPSLCRNVFACLKNSRSQIYVVEEIVRYRLLTHVILRISSIKTQLNAKVMKVIVKRLIFSA